MLTERFATQLTGSFLTSTTDGQELTLLSLKKGTLRWLWLVQYWYWYLHDVDNMNINTYIAYWQQDLLKCWGELAGLWLPEERLWKLCLGGRPRMLLVGGENLSGWGGSLIKVIGMMLMTLGVGGTNFSGWGACSVMRNGRNTRGIFTLLN